MAGKQVVSSAVSKYDSDVYDRLNVFRRARQLLAKNRHHILDLGDVFVKHKVHEQYGLSLLHKHFDLFENEYLIRTLELRHGIAYMNPVPRHTRAVPYLWRASRGPGGQWQFFPLEFLAQREEGAGQAAGFERLGAFMLEIGEKLESLNLLDVFGIATTNILTLPCNDDQILVETTDSQKRLLTVQAEARADVNLRELTETLWTFRPGDDFVDLSTVAKCKNHCFGHCKNHCKQHCKGHCKQHCQVHCKNGHEQIAFDPRELAEKSLQETVEQALAPRGQARRSRKDL